MGGGGAEEVFVGGAAFFCADLPKPRALTALANIVVILEHDGREEGRRTGVLALDLAGAFLEGAGGRTGSILVRVDPDTPPTLSGGGGEGAGEALVGRARPPFLEDEGDPATIGVADTA